MKNYIIPENAGEYFCRKIIVNSKVFRLVIFPLLFLPIIFILIVLFIYPQNKLYAQNSQEYNDTSESAKKMPFIFPLDGEIILSFRKNYFYDEKKIYRRHTGIDIKGGIDQNVFASGDGIISYIGFSPIGGRTIVIRHNDLIRTTYLNLQNIFVCCGDHIHQGDIIGTIGANDDPSSPEESHLHFGIIYNGFYLDPEDILKISYKNITGYISLEYVENDFHLK
ncbi:MAG: M23 family metallopeptidase [Candidatus Humimicrobiaceae bacterium]